METLGNKILPNSAPTFYCQKCDYGTCKKSSYDDHLLSAKHQKEANGNKIETNGNANLLNYSCEKCQKNFNSRSGLWKHKKKCSIVITDSNAESFDKDQLILMLIKQNAELIKETSGFKSMMMEQQNTMLKVIENGTHNTTNSHNKSFNLQFFLNETCKDAMNIMDFVNSLKIELSDLENVGKVGYVNGMSSIIVKNLNLLDETKRPVHCTDTKREVMYVKDENKWEKEDENKKNIRKLIKHVTHKNTKLFKEYKQKYPGCEQSDSKYSDTYDKLIVEAFGGKGDNDIEKENKIIRNISKVTTIDKNV
jgi:hypothetical protein